jgi:hypothetical protein
MPKKKAKRKPRACTYCGATADTVDHVPPRCLFARPFPSTLITVPACRNCNGGAKLDDEYFRLMTTMKRQIVHPDAEAGRSSSVRSLARIEAGGLRSTFLGSLEDTEVLSPAGLYLGTVPSYGADPRRLCLVVRRVTLGLLFHEAGERLHEDYEAVAMLPAAVANVAIRRKLLRIGSDLRRTTPRHEAARNVLSYWWARVAEDPKMSAWLLLFYERLPFVTIIRKKLS